MDDQESKVQEEVISSDEEFVEDEDEVDTESSSDVDAKIAEEDVFDIEFFKCYSALKKRDDKIYDENVKFFNEYDGESSDEEETKAHHDGVASESKPPDGVGTSKSMLNKRTKHPKMTLLDHQINLTQDDPLEEPKVDLNKEISKSYYEKELEEIKKSIEQVGDNIDSEDEEDLLILKDSKEGPSKPRKKINDMLDRLEEEEDEDINHLKQIWSDSSNLTKEEKFLRNYIVNKLYIPKNDDNPGEKESFFSKNLDEMSDADDDDEGDQKEAKKRNIVERHSDVKNFDKITRIPRNSTKTIRDLMEKQEKKEKRAKALEKEKKKRKLLKDADCEDIIGDMPTKFHYRETEPNDYGLTAEELLMATDEELEQWAKLHDAIAYKTPEEELATKRRYEQKRDDIELKRKIFKSIYSDSNDVNSEPVTASKKARNKKRKRNVTNESHHDEPTIPAESGEKQAQHRPDHQDEEQVSKRRKRHKRGVNHKKFAKAGVAPDRLLAYGLSKTKLKKSKLL